MTASLATLCALSVSLALVRWALAHRRRHWRVEEEEDDAEREARKAALREAMARKRAVERANQQARLMRLPDFEAWGRMEAEEGDRT